MALFSRNDSSSMANETKTSAAMAASGTERDLASVLEKPRITEKAMRHGNQNVYTFVVRRDATKHEVKRAVREIFNVTPVKVNIVNKAPRQHLSRRLGRTVTEKGMKKAYVYLKDGDSINLI